MADPGCGCTLRMDTYIWMRDGKAEAVEVLPWRYRDGAELQREKSGIRWSVSGMELTLHDLQDAEVRLYGVGGQLVLSRNHESGTVTYRLPAKGMYVVSVDGKSQAVVTE